MAKKKKSIESILANGEKFFKRGNFPLALREFETVQKTLQRDDIAEKIAICERENRGLRAKELIKKGNRAVAKNDLDNALAHFKEALSLLDEPEPWLPEKIASLENEHVATCADADASKAEAEGNFAEAANLYALAAEKMDDPNLLLKSASCLVRAGEYAEALQRFSQITDQREIVTDQPELLTDQTEVITDPTERLKGYSDQFVYEYGFALAKTGDSIRALTVWNLLSGKKESFLRQKGNVFALALSGIHQQFNTIVQKDIDTSAFSSEAISELRVLFEQADDLSAFSSHLGTPAQQELLKKIVTYLNYELIETAWNRGEYDSVFYHLEQLDGNNDPRILSLKARTAFHLSEREPSSLNTMVIYWLTAIYSMEISGNFSSDAVQREKIQERLTKMAEARVNVHINTPEGRSAARRLKLEKRLIADLMKIGRQSDAQRSGNRQSGAKERGYAELVCAPGYAALSGLSQGVLEWIISNRDYFDDTAHYLETGGYYCRAWESLYLMKIGDLRKAVAHLNSLPHGSFDDEFCQYVRQIVNFEYGKSAIEKGKKDFLKYFDEAHLLFESHPTLENQLIDFLHDLEELDSLQKYEQVLSMLYDRSPSEDRAKIFSFVMMQSAISRGNKRILPPRAMKQIALNALQLDPENEYAHTVFDASELNEEAEEMMTAMSRRKFAKASRLVNSSSHSKLEEYYFETMDHFVDQCEGDYHDDPEFAVVLLQEMYEWARAVDGYHSVTERMRAILDTWMRSR